MPPLMAVRLAADLRPSADGSAVRTRLSCRQPACLQPRAAAPYRLMPPLRRGGSVAEWLACWTQAQKDRVQIAVATLSGNSLRQTVHTYRASVHQAAKLVAVLLRVTGVTAGLAESYGSLPPGL